MGTIDDQQVRNDASFAVRVPLDGGHHDYWLLTFSATVSGPSTITIDQDSLAERVVAWYPSPLAAPGDYTVTVTVTDELAALSSQTTFHVTMSDYNRTPPGGVTQWFPSPFSSSVLEYYLASTQFTSSDSQDGSNVTFSATGLPSGAALGSDGTFTWNIAPLPTSSTAVVDAAWYTSSRIEITVADNGTSDQQRSTRTALYVDPEVVVDLDGTRQHTFDTTNFTVAKHTPIALDAFFATDINTGNGTGVAGNAGVNSSTFSLYDVDYQTRPHYDLVGGPAHAASFTLNDDGTFSYLPQQGFRGIDRFSFQIDHPTAWYEIDKRYEEWTITTAEAGANQSNIAFVTIAVGPSVVAHVELDVPVGHADDPIWVNDDDDDGDGMTDNDQLYGGVEGEDDLVKVDLSYDLRSDAYAKDFKAQLDVYTHNGGVRLWDSATKDHEIVPWLHDVDTGLLVSIGMQWPLANLPASVWIEATDADLATLRLTIFAGDGAMYTDTTHVPGMGSGSASSNDSIDTAEALFDVSVDEAASLGNPLILVGTDISDTAVTAHFVQLSTVDIRVELPRRGAGAAYWVDIEALDGARLWADAERTEELPASFRVNLDESDLNMVVYLEPVAGAGHGTLTAQIGSTDPFLGEPPQRAATAKQHSFYDGVQQLAQHFGQKKMETAFRNTLIDYVKSPLSDYIADARSRTIDPNELKRLDDLEERIDPWIDNRVRTFSGLVLHSMHVVEEARVHNPDDAIFPTTLTDVMNRNFAPNPNGPVPPVEVNASFSFNGLLSHAEAFVHGEEALDTLREFVLSPQRLASASVRVNMTGPAGRVASATFGVTDVHSFTNARERVLHAAFATDEHIWPTTDCRGARDPPAVCSRVAKWNDDVLQLRIAPIATI